MLYKMVLIREFEELAIQQRVAGKIYGVLHPYVGEEAVAVGVCSALRVSDRITSTHRGHGHCIAKGANVNRMMAELYGRVDGTCKGNGGSMHISDFAVGVLGANGIVGGGLPIATGAALAAQLDGKGDVAVAFFGEGAVEEGEFHEAMNIASVWKLPVIFVCENNLYAAGNAATSTQAAPNISAHAPAYDMPGITIDGNDLIQVHQTAHDAVRRARSGSGPTLMECKTFRVHSHVMREVPSPDFRPPDQVLEWRGRDPIQRYETYLESENLIDSDGLLRMRARVDAELRAACAFAEASPFPDPIDLLADVYAV